MQFDQFDLSGQNQDNANKMIKNSSDMMEESKHESLDSNMMETSTLMSNSAPEQ